MIRNLQHTCSFHYHSLLYLVYLMQFHQFVSHTLYWQTYRFLRHYWPSRLIDSSVHAFSYCTGTLLESLLLLIARSKQYLHPHHLYNLNRSTRKSQQLTRHQSIFLLHSILCSGSFQTYAWLVDSS